MNFAIVSKYRTELMGIATLWGILFYYGKIDIPTIYSLTTLKYNFTFLFFIKTHQIYNKNFQRPFLLLTGKNLKSK